MTEKSNLRTSTHSTRTNQRLRQNRHRRLRTRAQRASMSRSSAQAAPRKLCETRDISGARHLRHHGLSRDDGRPRQDAPSARTWRTARDSRQSGSRRRNEGTRHRADRSRRRESLSVCRDDQTRRRDARRSYRTDRHRWAGDDSLGSQERDATSRLLFRPNNMRS